MESKYLKYKKKYIDLKQTGGNDSDEIKQLKQRIEALEGTVKSIKIALSMIKINNPEVNEITEEPAVEESIEYKIKQLDVPSRVMKQPMASQQVMIPSIPLSPPISPRIIIPNELSSINNQGIMIPGLR